MTQPLKFDFHPLPAVNNIADLGAYLGRACETLESAELPHKTENLLYQLEENLGLDDTDSPLAVASRLIATDLDNDVLMKTDGYHNGQHAREVMIAMSQLILIQDTLPGVPLTAEEKRLLLTSALVHDLKHDGTKNGVEPYRLEKIACSTVEPYLAGCGVSREDRHRIESLVLCTDIMNGPKFTPDLQAEMPAVWPEKQRHQFDASNAPRFALLGSMMQNADTLPSAGFDVDHAIRQGDKLSAETNGALKPGLSDSVFFLDKLLGRQFNSPAGSVFNDNLETIFSAAQAAQCASAKPVAGVASYSD